MVPPVVADYQQSNVGDISTTEVTASLTWQAGDLIVVIGLTEDQTVTLALPTASGLTFTVIREVSIVNAGHLYSWQATAGSSGSGAITSVTDGSSGMRALGAFAYRFHGGIGNTSFSTSVETVSVRSLVRGGANSAVLFALVDWTANADITVTASPVSGGVQRIAVTSAVDATQFLFSWTDQGAAGTSNVGISAYNGVTNNIMLAIEILGSLPVMEQYGFRGRNDDGSEATATWKAAQNADFPIVPDTRFRLRFGVNATGDLASKSLKLQYRKVGAASWRDVDTTG